MTKKGSGLLLVLVVLFCTSSWAEQKKAVPITLRKALHLAQERNETYLISTEKQKQISLARDRAWAAFWPVLSAGGTFTHADKEIAFSERVIQRQDSFAGQFALSMTLFGGPQIPGLIRSYRQVEAASQQTLWDQNSLAFEVARAYFAALASNNLLAAAQRTLATAKEYLLATKVRRSAGEALGVDETRARIEVVSAQGTLEKAKNTHDGSMDYLGFLIGQKMPLAISHHEVCLPPERREKQLEQTLKKRPDLRAASLQVQALQTGVTESWMDYLPQLSVTGNYRITQNTGWSGDVDSWNIVVNLDWLLFDGGFRRATINEMASRLNEAKLQKQYLERSAQRQVRQALRDVKSAGATLVTAQQRLRLAKQNQSMVLSRYRAGLATSLEVIEASDSLTQAEVLVVSEELNLSLIRLELLQSLGLSPLGEEIISP